MKNIIKKTVFLEGHSYIHSFACFFLGRINLRLLSTMDVNEFCCVTITNECCAKKTLFWEGVGFANIPDAMVVFNEPRLYAIGEKREI